MIALTGGGKFELEARAKQYSVTVCAMWRA